MRLLSEFDLLPALLAAGCLERRELAAVVLSDGLYRHERWLFGCLVVYGEDGRLLLWV